MKNTLANCHPMIKQRYAEIGNNELGYIDDALACVMLTLNEIVSDENVSSELREKAAFAAANLLISDFDV